MSTMTQERLAFLDARFHAHVRTTGKSVIVKLPTGYVMRTADAAILADENIVMRQETAQAMWERAGKSDAFAARDTRRQLIDAW